MWIWTCPGVYNLNNMRKVSVLVSLMLVEDLVDVVPVS